MERILRRSVTVPLYLGAFVAGTTALPVLVPVVLVIDAIRRTRLGATRAVLFVVYYLGCESAGIIASFWLWLRRSFGSFRDRGDWLEAHYRLQRWWASALLAGGRRLFGLRFVVEGDDALPLGQGPFLLFVRHVSVADTLLAAVYLSARHGHRLRYVLKRELLWDPCLDIVGHRLPNCFVRRGAQASEPEIARVRALARDLGPNEGVLIYPEGTRFTPKRRLAVLRRLEQAEHHRWAERARELRNVLPPRLGGTLALLEACPQADVLICAHSGFEGTMRLTDLVSGTLVGARVHVRFWREAAESIPRDREARVRWLFDRWSEVDAWVSGDRDAARSNDGPRSGLLCD